MYKRSCFNLSMDSRARHHDKALLRWIQGKKKKKKSLVLGIQRTIRLQRSPTSTKPLFHPRNRTPRIDAGLVFFRTARIASIFLFMKASVRQEDHPQKRRGGSKKVIKRLITYGLRRRHWLSHRSVSQSDTPLWEPDGMDRGEPRRSP